MAQMNRTLLQLKTYLQDNLIELWASFSLFIGLPVVATLYFDYRAGLLLFFIASVVTGILALRNN